MKRSNVVSVLVGISAFSLVAGSALAVVNSSMPGNVCQAMFETDNGLSGPGANWLRHGAFWDTHSQGAVKNDHTSTAALVNCAVPRRNPATTTGLANFEAYIKNNGGTFSCDLISTDKYNTNIVQITRSTSATGNQTLSWGNSVATSYDRGNYDLLCFINPQSVIYGFWYSEN